MTNCECCRCFLPTQLCLYLNIFLLFIIRLKWDIKGYFLKNLHGKMSLISIRLSKLLLLTLICFWRLQNISLSEIEETSVEVIHSLLAGIGDKRQHRDSPKHFIAINLKQNITEGKLWGFFCSFVCFLFCWCFLLLLLFLNKWNMGKTLQAKYTRKTDFNSSSHTWLDFVFQPAKA